MKRRTLMPGAVLVVLTTPGALASQEQAARRRVEQATDALNAGEFQEALDGYREAEVMFPDSPVLAYNQAVAHYRLREFDKAREQFNRALATRDLSLEQKIKFNLGNCAYAEALERMSDLQAAVDRLRVAILHYRDALELNPDDQDARANIEMAQLMIKDLLDKLKQQQEQQNQQCPASQPSEDQQSPQDRQGEQEQNQQQRQGEGQQPEEGEQQGSPGEQESDPAGREQRRLMTPDEAERLLQAVRDKERRRRDQLRQRMMVRRVPVDRDW